MIMVKQILRRTGLVCMLMMAVLVTNAQNKKYITNHKILASALSMRYGIPASVILAVAAVESSGGAGPVAKVLNNHFGIVGENRFVNHRGHKSRYKQYSNEYASYIDFCDMISRKRFYARLKDNKNPQAWIKAMSQSGYSESPAEWEEKINSVMRSNKL